MFDSSPKNIRRIAQLAQERARLLERMAEIDNELMSGMATLLTLQRYISSSVRCFWREIRAARLRCW